MIWSNFGNIDFVINSFLRYFSSFERYFEVQEYQNRTQHEQNTYGVLSLDVFRQMGSPNSSPEPLWDPPLGANLGKKITSTLNSPHDTN